MKKLFTLALCVLFFSSASFGQSSFPNLTVNTHDGGTFDLFEQLDQGRSILLDFWWVECGNCVYWAPDVEKLYNDFNQNTEELFVIGLNITDPNDPKASTNDNAGISNFKTQYSLTYPDAGWENNGSGSNPIRSFWGSNVYTWLGGSFAQCMLIVPDGQNAANNQVRWYDNGAIHIPSGEGVAAIKQAMTDFNSKAIYDSTQTALNPSSVNSADKGLKVRLFPNPTNDVINVSLTNVSNEVRIEVMDVMGKQVYSQNSITNGNQTISTSGFASGIYFLSVITSEQTYTRKISVK